MKVDEKAREEARRNNALSQRRRERPRVVIFASGGQKDRL